MLQLQLSDHQFPWLVRCVLYQRLYGTHSPKYHFPFMFNLDMYHFINIQMSDEYYRSSMSFSLCRFNVLYYILHVETYNPCRITIPIKCFFHILQTCIGYMNGMNWHITWWDQLLVECDLRVVPLWYAARHIVQEQACGKCGHSIMGSSMIANGTQADITRWLLRELWSFNWSKKPWIQIVQCGKHGIIWGNVSIC